MLHKKTLLKLLSYFKFDLIKKAYIIKQLEKIDNEFISQGIFDALLEDANLERYKVYNIDWQFLLTLYKQPSTWQRLDDEFNPTEYIKWEVLIFDDEKIIITWPFNMKS